MFVVLAYVVPGAIGMLYAVRSVLVPVLIGLALAYIVNPLLRFAGREAGIGRLAGTISIMLTAVVIFATLMVTAVPLMYEQGKNLTLTVQDKYPAYIEKVLDRLDRQFPQQDEPDPKTDHGNATATDAGIKTDSDVGPGIEDTTTPSDGRASKGDPEGAASGASASPSRHLRARHLRW